ncbi:MAG: acyl-CoA dehydrogenase family protein [Microcoleaceae cyanobacterium]
MSHLLEKTAAYLKIHVAPIANEIDFTPELLQQAFTGLGNLEVLGLKIPSAWGGLSVNARTFSQFQELIARYSGALAFLQTQHQSASAMLSQSSNTALQQAYLPLMSSGKVKLGIGFSQLRRQGKPTLTATAVEGGYLLNGLVPWVTGWGIFDEFIAAATLPGGEAVFGIVPLRITQQPTGYLNVSSPMLLCGMSATNTVSVTLRQWFLPEKQVVFIKPTGWIEQRDRQNPLKASFFALGCAQAGIDVLETTLEKKGFEFIQTAINAFTTELNQCRDGILQAENNPNLTLAEKYKLRGWGIDLAVRCAHAAVTVSSGAANLMNHNAQRVYREALVFTISGQTTGLMEGTLSHLIRRQ